MNTYEIWRFNDMLHKGKVWAFKVEPGKQKKPKYEGKLLGRVQATSVRKAMEAVKSGYYR